MGSPEVRRPWRVALAILLTGAAIACGGGGGDGHPTPTPGVATRTPGATPTGGATATPGPTPTAVPNPFTIAAAVAPGSHPAVAFGAGRYLTTFSLPGDGVRRALYGVRLDAGGGALDDTPVLLSDLGGTPFLAPAEASYDGAAIGYDGATFGVFFRGSGSVGTDPGFPGQMVGFASVPPAGPPLRPAVEVDTQASFGMAQTAITGVTGASSFAVGLVGLYARQSGMVGFPFTVGQLDRVTVVVDGGAVDVRGPFVLGGGSRTRILIDSAGGGGIASNGTDAFVAWGQVELDVAPPAPHVMSATVEGALLTPLGHTTVTLAETTTTTGRTAVASDGLEFLVVWSAAISDDASSTTRLRAIRYRPASGEDPEIVAPPGGFVVADGTSAKRLEGVAFAGGTYLVAWLEDGVLHGARIAEDGTTPAPFVIDPGPVDDAALTSDGERFLIVLDKPTGATSDLLGLFVPAND
jgi:hypothetical protein